MNAYDQLSQRFDKISQLQGAQAVLHWDMQTQMPRGGAEARGGQLGALETLGHDLMTDPRVADWLDTAEANPPENLWERANLREMRRQWRHANAVESRLVEALAVAGTRCGQVWQTARPVNDFKSYEPSQAEVFALVREIAAQKAAAFGCSPYDALIDQFEPGMGAARIDEVFAPLRARIPTLIDEVLGRTSPLGPQTGGIFPIERQKALGLRVMTAMGFDFDRGRLDISSHPFCGGVPDDVRMTTRYRSDSWLPAFQGIVHETGHGLYEQGLPAKWRHQPVGEARSMGVHESQSLFWEMQVARSKPFLQWLRPHVATELGVEATVEDLYRRATAVKRGLIRVDADEVTYPAHVLMRFELEQKLVAGELRVADLPEAWREGMTRYLGVAPDTDRDGCMQDIHWTDGAVGYFPSYTLGAMIAAQLASAMRDSDFDLDGHAARGDLEPVRAWLLEKIHAQASVVETDDLIVAATGRPLSAATYLAHLEARYLG